MKLTKEDYMRLSKERLAELLVEMDSHPIVPPITTPIMPTIFSGWGCDGSVCANPHMDCINCPKLQGMGGYQTVTKLNTGDK